MARLASTRRAPFPGHQEAVRERLHLLVSSAAVWTGIKLRYCRNQRQAWPDRKRRITA